jgi:hypothetical protein
MSGRFEVFGIRREPRDGGSRKFLKNFMGPTAIHAFTHEREVFGRWLASCSRIEPMTQGPPSTDKSVDLGVFGPVGKSATEVRAFHSATVFGLTP